MNKKKYLIFSLFLFLPIIYASVLSINDILSPKFCLFAVFVNIFIFLKYQQNSEFKGLWYKPSNVFIFAYLCVNFQYVVDLCLNYRLYDDFYNPSTVNTMTWLSALGIVAFSIGYYLAPKPKQKYNDEPNVVFGKTIISFIQVLLFALWVLTADVARIAAGLTYGDEDKSTNSFESLFYCATIALLVTIIVNKKSLNLKGFKEFVKSIHPVNWICICAYLLIRLMSGDRGSFMYMLLAIFYTYVMLTNAKLRMTRIVVAIVGFALLLNLIGIARSSTLEKGFIDRITIAFTDFSSSDARFSERTISPLTEELAGSVLCNEIAVNEIDNRHQTLHYGKYTFYQIVQCIPFVSSFLANTLKIPDDELSSNIMMTDIYVGRHDIYQIGTTVVAESYLDMGVIGVIIMLLFIGYCFKYIDYCICIDQPTSIVQLCAVLLFASMAIYIPRSTFFIQLKKIIPILVLFFTNKIFYQAKR